MPAVFLALAIALSSGLPHNSWLGLRSGPARGALAFCTVGASTGVSVWVAVGGSASLDIIQVGELTTSRGARFFAAYGRGEPRQPNSLYVEQDLGPAGDGYHKFTVRLLDGSWGLS